MNNPTNASGPDPLIRHVIDQAQAFVEPDGRLEITSVSGGTVRISYRVVKDPTCAECVLTPNDLEQFLTEMFSREAPQIRVVEVEAIQA